MGLAATSRKNHTCMGENACIARRKYRQGELSRPFGQLQFSADGRPVDNRLLPRTVAMRSLCRTQFSRNRRSRDACVLYSASSQPATPCNLPSAHPPTPPHLRFSITTATVRKLATYQVTIVDVADLGRQLSRTNQNATLCEACAWLGVTASSRIHARYVLRWRLLRKRAP